MFRAEDIGVRLPAAVYYDFDNTALAHGAKLPSQDTIDSLARLQSAEVHTIGVTGRDYDDCQEVLPLLPGRFAIISGGADTVSILPDTNGSRIERTSYSYCGGFSDAQIHFLTEAIEDWLDGQPFSQKGHAYTFVPAQARMWREFDQYAGKDQLKEDETFILPSSIFINDIASEDTQTELETIINDGLFDEFAREGLFACAVTAQSGRLAVQIVKKLGTKEHAIRSLNSSMLRIVLRDTVGSLNSDEVLLESVFIGDGKNDLPGFKAVGLKVAMGDSHSDLIEAADVVIGKQSDDGFIEFIDLLASADPAKA